MVKGEKTFITSGMRADYYTVAVRTGGDALMTALKNAADHYLVVGADGEAEWLSVPGSARACELPEDSPLWAVLCDSETVSPIQAAMLFGNSVSVGVMRALVRVLIEEGSIGASPTYGSAFSGMDTIMAALAAEAAGVATRFVPRARVLEELPALPRLLLAVAPLLLLLGALA